MLVHERREAWGRLCSLAPSLCSPAEFCLLCWVLCSFLFAIPWDTDCLSGEALLELALGSLDSISLVSIFAGRTGSQMDRQRRQGEREDPRDWKPTSYPPSPLRPTISTTPQRTACFPQPHFGYPISQYTTTGVILLFLLHFVRFLLPCSCFGFLRTSEHGSISAFLGNCGRHDTTPQTGTPPVARQRKGHEKGETNMKSKATPQAGATFFSTLRCRASSLSCQRQ